MLNFSKHSLYVCVGRDAEFDCLGQKTAAGSLEHDGGRSEWHQGKMHIRPVRGTDSRLDKVGWKLESEFDILACSFKRSENDSPEFQKGFELRVNIDSAYVKILNDNVPAWLRPTVHFAQDGNRVSGKQQRKPCERQIERLALDIADAFNIRFD